MAIKVGTSGWSYPSWRPGFYPADLQPAEFLPLLRTSTSTRSSSTRPATGCRAPTSSAAGRTPCPTASSSPSSSPSSGSTASRRSSSACSRSATGSARCGWSTKGRATTGPSRSSRDRRPTDVRIAWDLRDESWAGVDGVLRVNDPGAEPFRYLRLREPPYSDDDLRAIAATIRDPTYVYLRHEDAPTAPAAAERLRGFL